MPPAALKLVSGLRWEQIDLAYTPYPVAGHRRARTTSRRRAGSVRVRDDVERQRLRQLQPGGGADHAAGQPGRVAAALQPGPGRQLEVGAKGGAFNGRLDGTFAYFAIEKQDLLITQLIDGIQTAQQVGKQTSHGIEIAVVGAADDHADAGGRLRVHRRRVRRVCRDRERRQHRSRRATRRRTCRRRSGTSRRRSASAASI